MNLTAAASLIVATVVSGAPGRLFEAPADAGKLQTFRVEPPDQPMKDDLTGFSKAAEKLREDPPDRGPGDPFRLRPGDP